MNALALPWTVADDLAVSVATIDSPLGPVHVAALPHGLCGIAFDAQRDALQPRLRRMFGPFFRINGGDPLGIGARFDAYFAGDLSALCDVPRAVPATPMQRRVWTLVAALDPGKTTTYAALAARLGMPRAQRAVGVCLASNPLPIVVPCHRVIAANGAIASHPGGAAVKRWLLHHEGVRLRADAQRPRSHTARSTLDPDDVVRLVVPRVAY